MSESAAELARRLAREAEAVCRHYLSSGRREGRYWLVGDADNTPGRSLYVRLRGSDSGKGAAGKWTDAATGEHGDLLDLIARVRRPGIGHRRPWARPSPPGGCSPWRSPSGERSPRAISAGAASRPCTMLAHCASIRAASTARTTMPHARPGRRCLPP
jgi:hypothetical protein